MVDIPRSDGPGFDIDVAAIRTAVLAHRAKVLFLTSPNNPDGTVIKPADLAELLELPVLVVLDEAYIEFCEIQESRMRDVLKRENLIVLRTFSKRAALAGTIGSRIISTLSQLLPAGLRVGYCAAPLWLMDYLWRVKQPYNVSIVAELAACAALDNPKYLQVRDFIVFFSKADVSLLNDRMSRTSLYKNVSAFFPNSKNLISLTLMHLIPTSFLSSTSPGCLLHASSHKLF